MKKNNQTKQNPIKEEDRKVEDQKILDIENQLKRAVADYQNLEKRVIDEKVSWIKAANKDLILRLLPGLDSLILAEKHTQDEGVKISIKHFLDILEQEGIKKIETKDQSFDPNLMEAVHTAQGPEGQVVEELKSGYTLYGQVLRPAQVAVGKEG